MSASSLFGSSSSTAASHAVCAVSQLPVVNVSVSCRPVAAAVSTVTSPVSALVAVTVTVPVGSADSFTVYGVRVAAPSMTASGPASAMFAVAGFASITIAAVSSSSTVTSTLAAVAP